MNIISHAALHRGLDELRCAVRRSLRDKVRAHRAAVLSAAAVRSTAFLDRQERLLSEAASREPRE